MLSAHGLRKAGAPRTADSDASEYQLMVMYGWTCPKRAALYVRKAQRKKTAAAGAQLLKVPPGWTKRIKSEVKSKP